MKPKQRLAFGIIAAAALTMVAFVGVVGGLATHPLLLRQAMAAARRERYLGPNPRDIRQRHAYDCGPAALQITLLEFGLEPSLVELGRDAGTSKNGTSMLGLKRACESHGIAAEGWKLTYSALQSDLPMPVIVQIDGNHFMVVRRAEKEWVVANDPALGTIAIARTDFESRWSGYALVLRPGSQTTWMDDPSLVWGRRGFLARSTRTGHRDFNTPSSRFVAPSVVRNARSLWTAEIQLKGGESA